MSRQMNWRRATRRIAAFARARSSGPRVRRERAVCVDGMPDLREAA